MSKITIELDCPPGPTRPDTYYKQILEYIQENNTLNNQVKEHVITKWDNDAKPVSTSFGNWTWELPALNIEEKNVELRKFIFKIIEHFYSNGLIRCGGVS